MEIIVTILMVLISLTVLFYIFLRVNLEKLYLKDFESNVKLHSVGKEICKKEKQKSKEIHADF